MHSSPFETLLRMTLNSCSFPTTDKLQAANGTPIATYGTVSATLQLNNRTYSARLVKADVKRLLFGADFPKQHNLLVDIRGKRLIEADTYSAILGAVTHASVHQLSTICPVSNQYREVLLGYQEIIQPTFSSDTVLHGVQHYISTSGIPVHAKARMLAPDKLEMEKMGIIRKSNSPWAFPLYIVPKLNGGWRPCSDYWRPKSITTPDRYPIPHIQEFASQLAGKTIISTIILIRGYHQIPVAPSDIHKTAIIKPFGLHEYIRMSFRL